MDQADCADQGTDWKKEKARSILDVSDIFSILEFSVSCVWGFFFVAYSLAQFYFQSHLSHVYFVLSAKDVAQEHDEN